MNKVWIVSGSLGYNNRLVILRVFDNQTAAHKFALAVEGTPNCTFEDVRYSDVVVREYGVETNV